MIGMSTYSPFVKSYDSMGLDFTYHRKKCRRKFSDIPFMETIREKALFRVQKLNLALCDAVYFCGSKQFLGPNMAKSFGISRRNRNKIDIYSIVCQVE